MAEALVNLVLTTTTLLFSDSSSTTADKADKAESPMLIKKAKAIRHHVAFHVRKRHYWINGAILISFIYLFFVWVATRSISATRSNSSNESTDVDGFAEFYDENDTLEASMAAQVPATSRCAINFFGLPRSFESMVLPSMDRNVFVRNARFGCDYFIHYYHREEEPGGRAGQGGSLNPDEVLLMKAKILSAAKAVKSTPNRNPAVIFVKDTEEEFWEKRGELVEKYRTTKSADGNYLYYPWKARTYHYPESLDNIVKQWYAFLLVNFVFWRFALLTHYVCSLCSFLPAGIVSSPFGRQWRNSQS